MSASATIAAHEPTTRLRRTITTPASAKTTPTTTRIGSGVTSVANTSRTCVGSATKNTAPTAHSMRVAAMNNRVSRRSIQAATWRSRARCRRPTHATSKPVTASEATSMCANRGHTLGSPRLV
jgi:hypothetical protein